MSKLIFADATFDKCALCASSSALQTSHIIPSFVFRWFKDSSATGYMRFGETPNLRVQDGLKCRMLCTHCEQLLSSWEKTFSEICFRPIVEGHATRIRYSPWMLKFAVSVSWRVLQIFCATDQLSVYPPSLRSSVDDALTEWSNYLLGSRPHPGRHEQHMFLVDTVDSSSIDGIPPNINRYFTRTVQCDVVRNEDSAITYAKMGRFVLFGFIVVPLPHNWKGTKLNANHGIFGIRDIELPRNILDYMLEQAKSAGINYSGISKAQQEKIRKSYEANPGRVAESESIRAMDHDVQLFGNKAFEFTQPSTRASTTDNDEENAG